MARKNNFDDLFKTVSPQSPGAFSGIETVVDQVVKKTKRRYGTVPLDRLRPNPRQPRKQFDSVKLEELGNSIEEYGLLEPLVVRESTQGRGYFEIACGERRWRAMQLKKITEAEAIILSQDCSDDEMEQIALIENVQRENLAPYELALAYDRLHKDGQGKPVRSIADVALIVRQPKSSVDDHLAILRVPQEVRQLIIDDPGLPLRIIRDLGNVESSDDRVYLVEEVRAGNLTSNGLTKVLQQLKKAQKEGMPESPTREAADIPSAYADVEKSVNVPSSLPIEAKEGEDPSLQPPKKQSEALPVSLAKRRTASPTVMLAALEQKLLRDSNQIHKITERLTEEIREMTPEEKASVRNRVDQWHIWTQQLLDLTRE